jgi:hypothetical protein
MKKQLSSVLTVLCTLAAFAVCVAAQMQEVKEKPRMYTYVAFWTVPRTQWADQAKQTASEEKMMEKAIADGGIVGYGDDQTLIHQPDGPTHDTWYSAMSEAALLNQLDQALGWHVRQPLLQLALRVVERRVFPCLGLHIESERAGRYGGDAEQEFVRSAAGEAAGGWRDS